MISFGMIPLKHCCLINTAFPLLSHIHSFAFTYIVYCIRNQHNRVYHNCSLRASQLWFTYFTNVKHVNHNCNHRYNIDYQQNRHTELIL